MTLVSITKFLMCVVQTIATISTLNPSYLHALTARFSPSDALPDLIGSKVPPLLLLVSQPPLWQIEWCGLVSGAAGQNNGNESATKGHFPPASCWVWWVCLYLTNTPNIKWACFTNKKVLCITVLQRLKDFKKIEQKPIQSKSANANFLISEIFADICFVHGRCKKRQSQSKGTGPKPFCHILAQSLQKLADILSLVRITTVSNSISHKICDKLISWFLIAQVRVDNNINNLLYIFQISLDVNRQMFWS